MFPQICSQIFTTNVSHFVMLKKKTNFLLVQTGFFFLIFLVEKEIIENVRKKNRIGIRNSKLVNSLSNINSNSDFQLS